MERSSKTPFLNCFFDNVDLYEVIDVLDAHIVSRNPGFMVSLNTDIAIRLDKDAAFREAFEAADLVLMDSQPLIKLCHRYGIDVKEKLSGSDLMPLICEHSAEKGYRCFILGGAEGVPQNACNNLKERFPALEIGCYSPEYGFEKDSRAIDAVIDRVSRFKPDVLFICLGAPKSEKILYPNIQEFDVPFTFSVGAAVDFAAGNMKRAPKWMQRVGLEWLFRFFQEPKRLFKRYFVDSWHLLSIIKSADSMR